MSFFKRFVSIVETADTSIKVLIVPVLQDNYTYIVFSENVAIVIDPSEFAPVNNELERLGLGVSAILITHEHHDHIGGVKQLQKKFKSQVIAAHNASIPYLTKGVHDGEPIDINKIVVAALSVPGHYSLPYARSSIFNNIAWYFESAGIIFTGDTLFSCGYGYISNGDEMTMWESLKKLRSLPEDTLIFSGHEYTLHNMTFALEIDPENSELLRRFNCVKELVDRKCPTVPTTMRLEKTINPFLRWDDVTLREKIGISDNDDFESFLYIRELKKKFNRKNR